MQFNTINFKSMNIGDSASIKTFATTDQETSTYNTHMPELKYGMAGEAVRFLQQFLICYGYFLPFNGQFDYQTEQAVMFFQSSSGLIADGVVGKDTWRAICDALLNYGC